MRIGLIGAGAVADLHAHAAESLPHVRLTAVCDLAEEAARRVAAPVGAATFTDYRHLIGSGLVDAVIVNTPHALHRQMVVDAAELGLHVLVEKPMATTLTDCDTMRAACEASGVTMVVGHIQHFLPEKVAAEAVLRQGEYGAPVMVHDYRSTDYRPGTRSAWFFSTEIAGGGALMNIGTHCLDRSVWLGGATAVSVTAATAQRFGVAVETDGVIQLELANDVSASISVVSDTPRRIDELMVVCERGVITIDPRRGTFVRQDGHTRVILEPSSSDIPNAFRAQLADFVAAVAGEPPRVSLRHGRHVVELVLAAYESAALGKSVTVGALPSSASLA
ncbi:Gfo/Idh/MocA family oxidoreductase [Micromonospora sp. DR5-3]|uniref:Gfo/Idh/MocA family protein n=1 Tax=unclassified Micromonospora TaxID=2617518 RepID=UPI0011D4DCD9|nr:MULTISPECIES: Gfo/Idh/MocA family oxidoreductase [unclassified Micromonospora]MCW3815975.1 Gfo/Idh/MocA family oxidoreductase [Micromonospora sp. DR5-3]TYC20834.1 Gfo/Idh/MocA family oxidoreductase [Micromonospora sp. MP36]